jgi:hypothetical protein
MYGLKLIVLFHKYYNFYNLNCRSICLLINSFSLSRVMSNVSMWSKGIHVKKNDCKKNSYNYNINNDEAIIKTHTI